MSSVEFDGVYARVGNNQQQIILHFCKYRLVVFFFAQVFQAQKRQEADGGLVSDVCVVLRSGGGVVEPDDTAVSVNLSPRRGVDQVARAEHHCTRAALGLFNRGAIVGKVSQVVHEIFSQNDGVVANSE